MEMLIGIVLCIIGTWFCWESSLIIQERKDKWRKGETDYYGNPLDD